MALATYFFVIGYEIGASQTGSLQYFDGMDWVSIGAWAAVNTSIVINNNHNPIPINYSIFTPGQTYRFRLIDSNGVLLSEEYDFEIPQDLQSPILNTDNTPLLNIDGTPLVNP